MREPHDPMPDPMRCARAERPEKLLARAVASGDLACGSRRSFVMASAAIAAAFVAGCAAPVRRPEAAWAEPGSIPTTPEPAPEPLDRLADDSGSWQPIGAAALPYARPRFLWARGAPDASIMNPMLPVTAVTVHHDGLERLVTGTSTREMAERLELYRIGHRARGWGDIGYHLVIDRAGRLWQGRAIRWQGAHVKDHNEGNVGVLVMGNFELQEPTAAQVAALNRVLLDLQRVYRVQRGRFYTHREWESARTLCPGKSLQPVVASLRTDLA